MTETALATVPQKKSLAEFFSSELGMEVQPFMDALKTVVFPATDRKGNAPTNAQMIAYLSVCKEVGLNPFCGMVWPFPMRDGGFKPVASVDGWLYIMNTHPAFEGYEYKEIFDDDKKLLAGEVTIYRNDRKYPVIHREYLTENRRETEPWKMIHRMLENRTMCQGIRRAMGIQGLSEQEEVERGEINITAQATEISRTTATATEELKDKLKKRGRPPATASDSATEAAPAQAPPAPAPVAPAPPPEPQGAPTATTPAESALPFNPDSTQNQTIDVQPEGEEFDIIGDMEPPPDTVLSDADRKALLSILAAKAGDLLTKQNATREQIRKYGYSNTKEITYKHYKELMAWAQAYKP